MTKRDISDEIKLAVEKQVQIQMQICPDKLREEPLDRLFAWYLFCSKNYSRKKIAVLLGKPRHTVENWVRDLTKATPERIAAIAHCKYTLLDICRESGRKKYEISASSDSDRMILAKKEISSILYLSGINETCFVTPDDKMYFNEDGKKLICDMLMNRVKRSQSDQTPESYAAYSDIRKNHFDIKHRPHYDWMLNTACSNLRDISVAYPDPSGETEYFTEDEIRWLFWRHACIVNQNYNALPGMALLGELPNGFYEKTHEAILDDIITTFDPMIIGEFADCDCKKLKHEGQFMRQRWIKYLDCVSDIRNEEQQRIFNELELCPELREVVEMFANVFLCAYDWDSLRKRTKSQDIKLGSNSRQITKEKTKMWREYIRICKKAPEDRTEDERILLTLMYESGKHCAKIYHLMPIGEVIELANMRFQSEEKGALCGMAEGND